MSWRDIKNRIENQKDVQQHLPESAANTTDMFEWYREFIREYGGKIRNLEQMIEQIKKNDDYKRAMAWKRKPHVKSYISMDANGTFYSIGVDDTRAETLCHHKHAEYLSRTIPTLRACEAQKRAILYSRQWQMAYYYMAKAKERHYRNVSGLPSRNNGYKLEIQQIKQ